MYLSHHGPHSLAPKRAENMKFSMVSSLQRIPADGSIRVGSIRWDDTAHDVFIFRRLTRFMMFTGFRLEGSTAAVRHLDNSDVTGLPLDNSEFRSGLAVLGNY